MDRFPDIYRRGREAAAGPVLASGRPVGGGSGLPHRVVAESPHRARALAGSPPRTSDQDGPAYGGCPGIRANGGGGERRTNGGRAIPSLRARRVPGGGPGAVAGRG